MRMQKIVALLLALLLALTACAGNAQENPPESWQKALNSITAEELAEDISYLASEELEGRRSQTRGSELAGKFIADHLSSLNLKTVDEDYFQEFKFEDLENYTALKQRLERMAEYGYSVPEGGRNVVGILEGSDKKDEYIVLTAHYDHMGINPERTTGKIKMHPGADDNASGTAALMEIAEAFTLLAEQGERPQRSIIFLFTDAEDWGLLGSRYFAENPPVPLKNTVAVLNMDMLGRNATSVVEIIATPDIDDAEDKNPDLFALSKEAAEILGLKLHLPTEEGRKERVFYRSDHFSFFDESPADNRIPVVFYTGGLHDDYHTSHDTADAVNNEKVQNIARFIFVVTLKTSEMQNVPDYIEQSISSRFYPGTFYLDPFSLSFSSSSSNSSRSSRSSAI